MSIITENPQLVVEVVEMSLRGSGFAADAWRIIRRCLLSETSPDGEELERLEELVDRARDDVEGPGLRVDLSKERLYI